MEIPGLWLVAAIVSPLIVCICPIAMYLKKRRSEDAWFNVWFMLNPKYGLGSQTLFWVVILVPLVWFLFFGLFSWRGYSVELSAGGFEEFIKISTLPIGLLSLSIPLTALVTYLHSTAQTAKQIEKNERELFYLHRREFVFYFDSIGLTLIHDVYQVSYKISPRIHGKLFKGAVGNGVPELNCTEVDRLVYELRDAERCLAKVMREKISIDTTQAYFRFCEIITGHINFLAIRDLMLQIEKDQHLISIGSREVYSIGSTAVHAAAAFECVRVYLTNLLSFANYEKGIKDISHDSISIDRIYCVGDAELNLRMNIVELAVDPSDDLYIPLSG